MGTSNTLRSQLTETLTAIADAEAATVNAEPSAMGELGGRLAALAVRARTYRDSLVSALAAEARSAALAEQADAERAHAKELAAHELAAARLEARWARWSDDLTRIDGEMTALWSEYRAVQAGYRESVAASKQLGTDRITRVDRLPKLAQELRDYGAPHRWRFPV